MDYMEICNERDMLLGNLSRFFLTDDLKELYVEYGFAKKSLERIFEYHCERINNSAESM